MEVIQMKKELIIGIAAAGYLALSVGANAITTQKVAQNEMKPLLTAVRENTQVQWNVAKQLVAATAEQKKATAQEASKPSIVKPDPTGVAPMVKYSPDGTTVSEDFVIAGIDGAGIVHGLPTEAGGEGIAIPLQVFKDTGAGALKPNDTVEVTWSTNAYMNQKWDEVKSSLVIIK